MDREQWLQERRTGIGASDAPAVCGAKWWLQAGEVWLDKVGKLPLDRPVPEWVEIGLMMEPTIAALYERRTGHKLGKPWAMISRHPEIPWMLCSLDRVIEDAHGHVEMKNVGLWQADQWGEAMTDDIPAGVIIQVNHQMAVVGTQFTDVAALFGGSSFRVYRVLRNERLIDHIIRKGSDFWEKVQRNEPPDPDWLHNSTVEMVLAMYGRRDEEIELPDPAVLDLVMEHERLGDERGAADKARKAIKAKLLCAMKGAAKARLADGTLLDRKMIHRAGYEVKETDYEQLYIHRPKLNALKERYAS